MPIKLFSLPIVLFTAFLFKNEPHRNNTPSVTVHINGGSYLTVHGKTNINKFHCRYTKSLSDTLHVGIIDDETDKLVLENASINLGVMQFDCGNKLINKDFQKLLQAGDFPELKIEVLGVRLKEDIETKQTLEPAQGAISSANIRITIAGKQNEYQLEVDQPANSQAGTYSGSLHINIRDFGLIPPRKFLGLMKVNEKVDIDFFMILSFLD